MLKSHTKKSFALFFALFAYKVIIEIIYYKIISPLYSYYGLTTDIDLVRLLISTTYLVIFFISIPNNFKRVSTTIYIMTGIFIFIPTLSYYWLNSQSHLYTFYLLICFITISIILRFRQIYITDHFKNTKVILLLIFIIYVISSLLIVVSQGGVDPRALSFDTIYDLRADTEILGVMRYILNWNVKAVTPFFTAYFYFKKKYNLMLFVLSIQLLLYLTFGYKAYLFSIAFLVVCLFLDRHRNFNVNFIWFYIGINIISVIMYISSNITTFLNSIPFRMVFVPAQAQYQYYDFFSVNPKVNFADGLIGSIFSIESPYSMSMFNVISNAFYGSTFNQNTGIFGDAYGNGGVIGMIAIAVMFGLLLYLLDAVTRNVPNIITISAFSYMTFVLNDNSLLTAFLTGGFGLLILLFYIFNIEIENKSVLLTQYKYSES